MTEPRVVEPMVERRLRRVIRFGPVARASLALPLLWWLLLYALDLPVAMRLAIGNWVTVLPMAFAAAFAWRTSRLAHLEARQRRGWVCIAIALAVDAIGFLAFGWYEAVLGIDPTYNWVNLLYYVYFVAMFVGLLKLTPPSQTPAERPMYALDVLAVGLAGAMLLAEFVAHPILDDNADPARWRQVLTLVAYPMLGALSLFGVASLLMRLPEGVERRPYQLLCGAVALFLLADSSWAVLSLLGNYDTGAIGDLGWLLGACLFVAATEMAWREKRALTYLRGTYREREFTRLLPYLAMATGMGVLLVGILGEAGDLVPLALLGIALAATVFARQWLDARSRQARVLADSSSLAERRLAALVERSNEVIFVLGRDLRIRYASPGAARLFGPEAAADHGSLLDAIHPGDQARARALLEEVRDKPAAHALMEWRIARTPEQWLVCENALGNLLDDESVQGIVVNVRDVSEQKALEARLRFQSLHDPLTEVANRALFIDRLMQALTRRKRHGGSVAVLLVDLDHFQLINDSIGAMAADHVLRSVANRLLDTVRMVDTVARFGGDEFAVLLEESGARGEVLQVADRLLGVVSTPLDVDARAVQLSASIGVAFAGDDDDAENVLRNSSLAVGRAKREGRSRVVVFDGDGVSG